jgi:hypothetical protein
MAQNTATALMNNFIGGLKTEFTGLNFPENACTSTANCVFSLIGDVSRRGGINYESNYQSASIKTSAATKTYQWKNVGGDGETQILVRQNGGTLYFYLSSSATVTSPLSAQILAGTVNIASFLATNAVLSFDPTIECTFADGNGYLFVFNQQCDPFYVTYNTGTKAFTSARITIQTRDFAGVLDGLQQGSLVSTRPPTLSNSHQYNLVNQGWTSNSQAASNTNTIPLSSTGSLTWALVSTSNTFYVGQVVIANGFTPSVDGGFLPLGSITGTITAVSSTSLTFTESSHTGSGTPTWWIITSSPNLIPTWFSTVGNYPSNSDQWWTYRNTSVVNPNQTTPTGLLGQFDPSLAVNGYILPSNTQAPQGSVILNTFVQTRTTATGVPGITDVTTTARPTAGCWFAGRIWYTGVNSSFQATGDISYTTWTETIYFSTTVTNPLDFGTCYQQNDPTSSTLYELLPTDGGSIVIQGSGAIRALFPIKFGLIVFADNGIWFIGGGSTFGFTANDYTIIKISNIQTLSSQSIINVQGFPMFWNAEGIYYVSPSQNGGSAHSPDIALDVQNLALGTILTYYSNIPMGSKIYARGDFDQINYIVQWAFRSTPETSIYDRYNFDTILNYNIVNKAFYPYTVSNSSTSPYVSGINYVQNPSQIASPAPVFKYLSTLNRSCTFSEENDFTTYTDWTSALGTGLNYTSNFTTGYMLGDKAQKLWQPLYVWVYSENMEQNAYMIQGVWDYASGTTSGKISTRQVINNNLPNFNRVFRRHKIRGHGNILQLQITSVPGQPFDFMGWSILDQINAGA